MHMPNNEVRSRHVLKIGAVCMCMPNNANTAKQFVALQADIQSIEAAINHTRQVIESLLAQLPASIAADKQRELEDALP